MGALSPHVFAIADSAFCQMQKEKRESWCALCDRDSFGAFRLHGEKEDESRWAEDFGSMLVYAWSMPMYQC